MKRVVITGMGTVNPIANSVEEYRVALKKGVSGAVPITRFDAEKFKTKFACELKEDFDALLRVDKKAARRLDLYSIYALYSADEAISDANITPENCDLNRVGVVFGSGIGGLGSLEKDIEDFAKGDGTPRYSPLMIPRMISNIAAGHISIKYGFGGINFAPVSACATGNHAIGVAFDNIRLGRNDIILTGGAEAGVTKVAIGAFSNMKALSSRNDDPKTASRPFDGERDGFVMGEGAGTLVLEELEHAKARGAKIYAEVVGTGATADAYHITAPHPDGVGVIRVMNIALDEAGMKPGDIDYINVHGTSTPLGDVAELTAIKKVFGEDAYDLNISSTKSMTGHLLGAAGAIESIACILAINDNFIPPTINHENVDPAIDPKLNLTLNKKQERKVRTAMNNGFGFGGHNSTVIFKEYV
ncbi:MAG: 3-oxoacyl-[acyl-carrier-protein] synthase II [Saprospiraceae bacterium]|jgi:3-oxoacyl-[acyl-carrier-protein] synthase II